MKKALLYATAIGFALSAGGLLATPPAFAKNDKDKTALAECKSIADPKAKDECVKQAGVKEKADKVKADKADKVAADKVEKVKPDKIEKVKGGKAGK